MLVKREKGKTTAVFFFYTKNRRRRRRPCEDDDDAGVQELNGHVFRDGQERVSGVEQRKRNSPNAAPGGTQPAHLSPPKHTIHHRDPYRDPGHTLTMLLLFPFVLLFLSRLLLLLLLGLLVLVLLLMLLFFG